MLNQIIIRKACLPRRRSPTNFKQISNASKTLGGGSDAGAALDPNASQPKTQQSSRGFGTF